MKYTRTRGLFVFLGKMVSHLEMHSSVLVFLLLIKLAPSMVDSYDFIYNGFRHANVSLNGDAEIESKGLLRLTNTSEQGTGHAFHPVPVPFKSLLNRSDVISFSTTFVFAIIPQYPDVTGHGIAFTISRSTNLNGALPSQHLGLFNSSDNGNASNPVVAVEMDTIRNQELGEIDDNHVGIDINSLRSNKSAYAGYYNDQDGSFQKLSLTSGEPIQAWIEYSNLRKQLNVTLSPFNVRKPNRPLLSSVVDLASIVLDEMYVGFSSSTGTVASFHYILGWSFRTNGPAQSLDLKSLPTPPRQGDAKENMLALSLGLPFGVFFFLAATSIVVSSMVRRKKKFAEILEDWELEYGPHRFLYKDLFMATEGFNDKQILGIGGFGWVYRGVLPKSGIEVAVKKVSHESSQGMREFVAEIASIGRIRHPNLVRLLGYCRRKGELLLVYNFMSNGSLDKYLFGLSKSIGWNQRFKIIKRVASGLLYLHEGWMQVVLHRDIKASNVLLDNELNGLLGDFGMAILYDHGTDPHTTRMVGTFGYIAPELSRNGRATTRTDVFAFGVLMLEVACGRRPIPSQMDEEPILVDWVMELWNSGAITEAADPRLRGDYVVEEMESVLKLGMLCSHPSAASRPSMRQVVQFLNGDQLMPEISPDGFSAYVGTLDDDECVDDLVTSFSSLDDVSILFGGR